MIRWMNSFSGILILSIWALGLGMSVANCQEYKSSVVGTDFDFIVDDDPSAFLCLEFKGHGPREMPDKSGPSPLIQEAFIFVAYFEDGTQIDIAIDDDFEAQEASRLEAMRYVHRLGKLPTSLRRGVDRVVIHKGQRDTTAFSDRGLIVLYSDNATKRISTHDLEETIFHESVHASWDKIHANSEKWRQAQATDGNFVTDYARKNPDGEDLAESALFAYTMIHHPDRIPEAVADRIAKLIPARIAFVEALLPANKPLFYSVAPKYECDGSGKTSVISNETLLASQEAFSKNPDDTRRKDCTIDLKNPGQMRDIVSNALTLGLQVEEAKVRAFLQGSETRYSTGQQLLRNAAQNFGIAESALSQSVEKYRHVNCTHEN